MGNLSSPTPDATTSTKGKIQLANDLGGTAALPTVVRVTRNPYKFDVYKTAAQNTGTAAFAKINFETEIYDTGSNYDNVTNFRFTAPVNGFYHFDASASTAASGTLFIISLYKNGVEYKRGSKQNNSFTSAGVNVSADIQLVATDFIEVFVYGNAALALEVGSTVFTRFNGNLIALT